MKRFLAVAIVATMGLFYAGSAQADPTNVGGVSTAADGITVTGPGSYPEGTVANGVAGSRHNLGAFGRHIRTRDEATGNNDGTTQICVFCHTPHHSNTDARPLWNRNMPNSSGYVGYGTTVAQTVVSAPVAGSGSLACLSCHDGVTTFDNLVNAPGKGTSLSDSGNPTSLGGWTFWDHGPGVTIAPHIETGSRVELGTDLTNDHPVNVKYNGGTKASLRPTSTVIGNINLSAGLYATAEYFNYMQQNRWAVGGFVTSGATIGMLLRSNTPGGAIENVECASCHDPHFSNGSYPEYTRNTNTNELTGLNVADGVFLRRVGGNMGSGVCRTCHNK